jgi:hypothetical protein
MLLRKLVVVGLAGLFSVVANVATAEDAAGPTASFIGADEVSFVDPSDAFGPRFNLNIRPAGEPRFARLAQSDTRASREDTAFRRYEVALVASGAAGFDVSIAQRGGYGFNAQGDVERESHSAELRLGRGLRDMPRDTPSSAPKWYIFAASEDEALIWRPGGRNEFGASGGGGFALQDRVEIGDMQAGVTYETNGWQASLAYVDREISVRAGQESFTQDADFVGFTLTMRH